MDILCHGVRVGQDGALPGVEQSRPPPIVELVELLLAQSFRPGDGSVLFGLIGRPLSTATRMMMSSRRAPGSAHSCLIAVR